MVQLFINRNEAVLPDDFEFNFTEENPLITKNGEFSLDISLSLLVPDNIKIFGFINRLNKSTVTIDYDALMIIDNRIRRGSVIVVSFTNLSVKIQFISGNSELNYIADTDKKIWDFDWGHVFPDISISDAYNTLYNVGYKRPYRSYNGQVLYNYHIYTPILAGSQAINDYRITDDFQLITTYYNLTDLFPLGLATYYSQQTAIDAVPNSERKNKLVIKFKLDATTWKAYQFMGDLNSTSGSSELSNGIEVDLADWSNTYNWEEVGVPLIMQPYLLYYIEKLPELLGYVMNSNVLYENDIAKSIFLINTVDTALYSDALPDLTISDFITAIEYFFRVTFKVNSVNKTIDIVKTDIVISGKRIVDVTVVDEHTVNCSPEKRSGIFNYSSIKYPVGDSTFFKYQHISDEIMSNVKIYDFQNFSAILSFVELNDMTLVVDKFVLLRDLSTDNEYLVYTRTEDETVTQDLYFITKTIIDDPYRNVTYNISLINKFRDLNIDNDSDSTLEEKVCPVEIAVKKIQITTGSLSDGGGGGMAPILFQLPKATNSYCNYTSSGFLSSIEKGITNISRINKLELAFYAGIIALPKTRGQANPVYYPFSYVDYYPDFFETDFESWVENVYKTHCVYSFRLSFIISQFHSSSIFDTSKEYEFDMINYGNVTIDDIIRHQNQLYVPIIFDRKINNNKEKLITGKFYKIIN